MNDDAVVRRSQLKYLVQGGKNAGFGHGPHPVVPLIAIPARQTIDDVYFIAEIAQLMDPGLMAVRSKKSLQPSHIIVEVSNIHAIFQLSPVTGLSQFHRPLATIKAYAGPRQPLWVGDIALQFIALSADMMNAEVNFPGDCLLEIM